MLQWRTRYGEVEPLWRTLNGAAFIQSFVDQEMKLPCIAQSH
jgi:hypothetical protein